MPPSPPHTREKISETILRTLSPSWLARLSSPPPPPPPSSQYTPPLSTQGKPRSQAVLAGLVAAVAANATSLSALSLGPRVLLFLLVATLCTLVAYIALLARKYLAKLVIRTLILPATGMLEREAMPTSRGRSLSPRRLVLQLRRQHLQPATVNASALSSPGAGRGSSSTLLESGMGGVAAGDQAGAGADGGRAEPSLGHPVQRSEAEVQSMLLAMAQAMGVHPSQLPPEAHRMVQEPPRFSQHVIHGVDAGVRLDAAHYLPPSQASLPPAQRRWVVYLGGNGELYELLLEEMYNVARDSGLGVFLFNFRGVSHSEGEVRDATDLVVDCLVVLEYMQDHLGALPNNILLYGHSIGGAVATIARAVHSPSGPLLSDRSFASFGGAAHGMESEGAVRERDAKREAGGTYDAVGPRRVASRWNRPGN